MTAELGVSTDRLNAILAQSKNFHMDLNTTDELKNMMTGSDNTDTLVG